MSDLGGAHAGNDNFHQDDRSKIDWVMFNMMGLFVISLCNINRGLAMQKMVIASRTVQSYAKS